MDEISELDSAIIAANINADTVRDQAEVIKQQALRIAELRVALAGEVGLVQLLTARDDLRPERQAILSNHRHQRALATLGSKHD